MSSKVLKRMATLTALCLVVMLTFMAGCSSSNNGSAAPGGDASSSGSGYDIVVTDGRLIVYNVTMSVTVENVGETMSQLRSRLREIGGWEQSSRQCDDGYVYCVLRVPTTELSDFLQQIESSGSVNESVITSKDITEKYSEVQKEKEILLSYQTALQQQLEQATTFGEQREIMYELSRVSEQIKSYDEQLTQYEQLADYSTVTLSVYGAETYEEPSYWDRLGAVFFGSTSSLGTVVGAQEELSSHHRPVLEFHELSVRTAQNVRVEHSLGLVNQYFKIPPCHHELQYEYAGQAEAFQPRCYCVQRGCRRENQHGRNRQERL